MLKRGVRPLFICIMLGVMAVPGITYALPAYNGIISLSPGSITISPGQTFSISVDVEDSGVNYNSAVESISLGDGLSFAGTDFTGSAFNVAGTANVEQGKYGSCVVISRSSTGILTETSHLANVLVRMTSTPDYNTSHNGTNIEQDWSGCGPSSDIYLNGEQANQGAEVGGEVFVNLVNQDPAPSTVTTPTVPQAASQQDHTSNISNSTATGISKSNGNVNDTSGQVLGTVTKGTPSTTFNPTARGSSSPVAALGVHLASANKPNSNFVFASILVLALALTVVSLLFIRKRKPD